MAWVNDVIQGLLLGGLYALFATGLSLIFGVMRLVNLAHGDLSLLAGYGALLVVSALHLTPFEALIVVVPCMAIFGYILQRGVLNHALDEGPMPPLLVTFGLSIVIQNALLQFFSADSHRLQAGVIEDKAIRLTNDVAIGWFPLLTLVVAIVVLLGLQLFLSRTRMGRAFRATSDNQRAAQLMGIDNRYLYGLAMAIALGVVGIAGVFMGIRTTFAPYTGPARLIFAYEAVIIGGLGSLWGTLVGGILLGVAQTVGSQINPGWGILSGHLLFLAILAFRPRGLFSKQVI